MNPDERIRRLKEGQLHLRFMISLYRLQADAGRFFLHEHPETAGSWREPEMIKLLARSDVDTIVSHQCEYGLMSRAPKWPGGAVKETHSLGKHVSSYALSIKETL